jgi:hypothetical protein
VLFHHSPHLVAFDPPRPGQSGPGECVASFERDLVNYIPDIASFAGLEKLTHLKGTIPKEGG